MKKENIFTWSVLRGVSQTQWEGNLMLAQWRQAGQFWLLKGSMILIRINDQRAWSWSSSYTMAGSDSDSWGKRLWWFPLVVSPWCKKRTWTWKPGNMRTWLRLTFQSGERCQGWCRIDSTPKSVGTLLYVPCAKQLLDSWILIRNIEYWVATSHLINNGISVKDIVEAGGPVARILRMASTTWWNGVNKKSSAKF